MGEEGSGEMTGCAPHLCDCLVCRNARHRKAVWAAYNTTKAKVAAMDRTPVDPNWRRRHPSNSARQPPTGGEK